METAKQKRQSEQRFPITFLSVPIQTLREASKAYFAFRRVDYHFRQDYKSIFLDEQAHVNHGKAGSSPESADHVSAVLRCVALRRKLVDAAVVVFAAVNRGAVEISESIDDHPIVGKATIWRALERMNNTLSPLPAANRS